jgi:hypothetical protein
MSLHPLIPAGIGMVMGAALFATGMLTGAIAWTPRCTAIANVLATYTVTP